MNHPNATAAIVAGALTVLVIYIASLFGLDEPPSEVGAALTTLVTAITLFVGNRSKP